MRSISHFAAHPHRLWVPSSLLSNGCQGFLPAGNRSQRGTGYSPPPSAKIVCIWSCNCILLCVAEWWLNKHSDSFVVLRYENGLMPWMWELICLRNTRSRYLSIRRHITLKQPSYSSPSNTRSLRKGRDHLKDLDLDGKVILIWTELT